MRSQQNYQKQSFVLCSLSIPLCHVPAHSNDKVQTSESSDPLVECISNKQGTIDSLIDSLWPSLDSFDLFPFSCSLSFIRFRIQIYRACLELIVDSVPCALSVATPALFVLTCWLDRVEKVRVLLPSLIHSFIHSCRQLL